MEDQETGNCDKLNTYLWPKGESTRANRETQHLTGSFVNSKILFGYRVLVCYLMWTQWGLASWEDFTYHKFWQLQYFTTWGIWMTTGLFTLLVIASILDPKPGETNSMWKWCTAVH